MEIPALDKIDLGGIYLPYLHYRGEGPPIIFMHATGFLPWLWHPIIREFVPQTNVWAPFICDYRTCDPHDGGLSWDIIARDLSVLCRRLHIDRPLLVGHSMGGTVSVIAAAKYGIAACGLVLIEPIFLPEKYYAMEISVESNPLASKAIRRKNHWKNEKDAWNYLQSKSFFSKWDKEVLELYFKYGLQKQEKGDLKLTCTPKSEAAIFMGGRTFDPLPLLKEITCPVMVVEGELTEEKALLDIQRLASLPPNGQYRLVPEAGHLIPMEKPLEIVHIIKEFQKEHFLL